MYIERERSVCNPHLPLKPNEKKIEALESASVWYSPNATDETPPPNGDDKRDSPTALELLAYGVMLWLRS